MNVFLFLKINRVLLIITLIGFLIAIYRSVVIFIIISIIIIIKIVSFESWCGGLPAPEFSNNPLRWGEGWWL